LRTEIGARGVRSGIPERHLPLVLPLGYFGVPEDVLNRLDAELKPMVDAGYSRNDDPLTAPIEVDPVRGFDPVAIAAPANQATFGGGDPVGQILSGVMGALNQGKH
jgi:hypothetical protein